MFAPRRRPDGRIEVPRTVEGPGGLIGDSVAVLEPGGPGYAEVAACIDGRVDRSPRPGVVLPPVDRSGPPLY